MYMLRITQRPDALTKPEFHAALRSWLTASRARTIGEPGKSKGRVWLLVTDGIRFYRFGADTTRQAVAGYLHSVEKYGDDVMWGIRSMGASNRQQVVFGPHQLAEHEFELFAYGQ
ncbi:MAG: hypothetical protein AVDCRST_MAG18-1395 [uncultured Thermomicrobiales bacterium]|uniref:Uncharacterized protein n=1 Tax=uncultured Thermomicrobiales bacterium TaxID=1645740 RepID=A0A6J4V2F1_9BACT|nr:MAG: hypothetical protein AVDCRST_MAG18-1395 [uncultured Thermomicrobiales bacterium]